MATTKPKAPRSAARTPARRKPVPDDRPMKLKTGEQVDLRAPWPFPISIGTKSKD